MFLVISFCFSFSHKILLQPKPLSLLLMQIYEHGINLIMQRRSKSMMLPSILFNITRGYNVIDVAPHYV